jgi:hypothetical protein
MKAQVKVSKHIILEVSAETQKGLFEEIAAAHEVFGESRCGCCDSEDIRPVYRKVTKGKKSYEYPEYHCENCRARLSLGCHLEGGTLFPQRRLLENGQPATGEDREKGKFGKHRGWTTWKGEPKGDA